MLNRSGELDAFKCRINLTEYAAFCGYTIDRKVSSRSSVVMNHANGDKIIIGIGQDKHWTYFSVRDDHDNGSIIDFVQKRGGGSLGAVRKELRSFMNGSPALPDTFASFRTLVPVSRDLMRVKARCEAMVPIPGMHPYLENERSIPRDVLGDSRFAGRIRIDDRHNAIFPHWNFLGICGYEIKNHAFTGFSPGGEKGLWASHFRDTDTALVITETAIDALSHFTFKRPQNARYASTAGTLNPSQPELIRLAAQKLPPGGTVILATDNDEGGDKLTAVIREALSPVNVKIIEERPSVRGRDWNDVIKV